MRTSLALIAMLVAVPGVDPKMIHLNVKFVESSAMLEGAKAGVLAKTLTEKETATLLEKMAGDSKVLHSPNLVLHNEQEGNIFLGDATPAIVTRYDVHIDENGKAVATAVTDSLRYGTSLRLKATAGEKIAFEMFEFSMSQPRRKPAEMKKVQTPHGEITDPEFQTVKYTLRTSVKDGDTVLIGPLDKPWGGKDDPKLWILVTAKVIPGK